MAVLLPVAVLVLGAVYRWVTYPSDRTPEGAYYRIVAAVNRGRPKEFFAYLEEAAQHACFTIRDYRKRSKERVLGSYPKAEQREILSRLEPVASLPDGPDVFAHHVRREGWLGLLRRDLSAVESVQVVGERATVQTVRGTRYAFRRRPNGIWGLSRFTATLRAEAERAARDDRLIAAAASDYARVQSPADAR